MEGRTHDLKCWPRYFTAIREGRKTFDVRQGMDRFYREGDTLRLWQYDPDKKDYVAGMIRAEVTYVMRGEFGIPQDVWVLGLKVLEVSA